MGLDDRLADAQQGRAAVFGGVHFLLERAQMRLDDQRGQLSGQGGHEYALNVLHDHVRDAFHHLKRHIAGEAVGYHHVRRPGGQIPRLHVA